MRVFVLVGLLGACFSPKVQPGSPCVDSPCPSELVCSPATMTCEYAAVDAATHGDAPIAPDDSTDAPPGSACFGTGIVRVCLLQAPTQPFQITTATTLDTASAQCLPSDTPSVCVLGGTSVTINATLTAHGSRPLVLVSSSQITVSGSVDVSSHLGGNAVGAAADPSSCVGGAATTRGGGPGGSFGGAGGAGGQAGGAIALAGPTTTLSSLRGGCPGGDGAGDMVGTGGAGGGAVAVIAIDAITITGHVLANGAGGTAASLQAGGGGGGAGGAIVLDAPTLSLGAGASVFANGGGGGEGEGTTVGAAHDGADPASATIAAPGGTGGANNGGDGGDGSVGDQLGGAAGGAAGSETAGGGGGGGGAGIIRVFGAPVPPGGVFSPHPS